MMTQQHCIAGIVVDTNNTPLEGASVKIYWSSFQQIDQVGSASTGANGQYVVHFEAGSRVIVRYDCFSGHRCHPAILSHLSGANDHMVNAVLYRVGQGYPRDDLLDIFSAYERVYLIDVSNNVPVTEIRKTYYSGGLTSMKHVDEITEQPYSQVKELYERKA